MQKVEERESVVLENEGQKIFGVLHCPIGVSKPPVVLMCHGLAGDKTGKYRLYVILSKTLASLGIASLRIDFRGSGDSEGDFADMTLESEVSDAIKGLEYLYKLPKIDNKRIGIFGRSLGGSVALMAARRYDHVKSLVTWAPLSDGDQWKEQWQKIHSPDVTEDQRLATMRVNGQIPGYNFFQELFKMRMEDELEALHDIPLLHIHGEKDGIVVVEHAENYVKFRAKSKAKTKFIRLPLSDHDFSEPKEQQVAIEETCKWFVDTI